MKIIGIDPSTTATGVALLEKVDNSSCNYLFGYCIKHKKSVLLDNRLLATYNELKSILEKYEPDLVAVESCFSSLNAGVAIRLGMIQGIIKLLISQLRIPLQEYSPAYIRKATVGSGRTKKYHLKPILQASVWNLEQVDDEHIIDAIATGCCGLLHCNQ